MNYSTMTKEQLLAERDALLGQYQSYQEKHLSLDLSRGKPCSSQLDLSDGLLTALTREDCVTAGFDNRNYGKLDGITEMKTLFSELYGVPASRIVVGGNSSLQLMFDLLMRAMVFGLPASEKPWGREDGLKWICVVPGYDRHFGITEKLGFELLSVPMTKDGPDMDLVEELVKDPKVKGIWCNPKYSNPTGNTYSDETVRRLASMKCAAPDFTIMWDNAYAVHDFDENGDALADIFACCEAAGNPDRVFYFASTSKITYPGAGVAMLAASEANVAYVNRLLGVSTIGYDKLNQLRHVKFLKDGATAMAHMRRLGALVHEKFEIALRVLHTLDDTGLLSYTEPKGGYFISIDLLPGQATKVYNRMREAGVTLTKVGATFPYGRDPEDRNLRLAPTYPTNDDLKLSVEILALCIRLCGVEHFLEKK